MFRDLIFLCIYIYTGHYYCKEYCLVLGTCISVHQEKESRDTTFKNGVAKTDSYFRENLVLNTGKKKKTVTGKYNCFLYKQNSKFWFGASFFDCVLWEMFSLNHLLACLFFPSAIPTAALSNLQAAKLKQKVHPFGQIQKGNCCQILCLDVLCPNIFVVKSFFGQTLQSDNKKIFNHNCFPHQTVTIELCSFPRWIRTQNIFLLLFFQWVARLQQLNRINFCLSRKCNILLL